MEKPITDLVQVTPEWLTERLQSNGHLEGSGEVANVHVESSSPGSAIETVHLTVDYSSNAIDLPTRIFLKIGDPEMCPEREVFFHNDIAVYMDAPPTVPCLDAIYDPDTGRAHLLFEDVSHTHYHGSGTIRSSLRAESEQIIDCYACFHAFWWDHSFLRRKLRKFRSEDSVLYLTGVEGYREFLGRFMDRAGDRLSQEQRKVYERALASFSHFVDLRGKRRLAPGNRLTLIHGDAKYANIFLPKAPSVNGVYLIDWEFWEVRMGTDDIANIALFGFADPRANLVEDLLRRYHDGLQRHGVEDYGWEDCWHDYRLSTIRSLFVPICSGAWGAPMDWCLQNLERSLLSFQDLNCAEFLGN